MYQNHSIKQNLTLTYSVTANEDITKGGFLFLPVKVHAALAAAHHKKTDP